MHELPCQQLVLFRLHLEQLVLMRHLTPPKLHLILEIHRMLLILLFLLHGLFRHYIVFRPNRLQLHLKFFECKLNLPQVVCHR